MTLAEFVRRLKRGEKRVLEATAKAFSVACRERIQNEVVDVNLSGKVLRRRTGRLANSVYSGGGVHNGRVYWVIGTAVRYGMYWEFGKRDSRGRTRRFIRPAIVRHIGSVLEYVERRVRHEFP